MHINKTNYRRFQSVMLLSAVLVLGFAFYIEFLNQLRPCPLCFMQRSCALLLGLLCIVGIGLRQVNHAKILSFLQCVIACFGLYFAGRQLWLQSYPTELAGQCMPGLTAMMHYFSWDMILKSFLWGSSDCSHVDWQWYGLSIPLWSAFYFVVMVVCTVFIYARMRGQAKF